MPLTDVLRFPDRCTEINPRTGMECGQPAVAVRAPLIGKPYPVCVHHTHGDLVPLSEVIHFAQTHRDNLTHRPPAATR